MIFHYIYITVLIILSLMVFACLIRAIKGPRIADRLMAVNMMGTIVMVMIAVLALMLQEGYLVDVCLIYAMISFLAVIVLSKVIIGVHKEKEETGERCKEEKEENAS